MTFPTVPLLIVVILAGPWHQAVFAQVFKARAALDQSLVRGRLRIHYTTTGEHAVDGADRNGNGVPDQVEDIATQTQAAWLLFVQGLGFPDPFKGERFREATFLDVHLISKEVLKSNGVAYDEIQRFKRAEDPPNTGSLCFNVATSVQASSNLTPAHEFFHLIQNGACYFKNPWYTEGTARWSEKALGLGAKSVGLQGPWPPSEATWDQINGLSYDAATRFWEPLARHADPAGDLPGEKVPQAVKDLKYVNGEPVLKDLKLHGWQILREILVRLGEADDAAFRELKLERWSEEEQRSPANTVYIRQVVERVMAEPKR